MSKKFKPRNRVVQIFNHELDDTLDGTLAYLTGERCDTPNCGCMEAHVLTHTDSVVSVYLLPAEIKQVPIERKFKHT